MSGAYLSVKGKAVKFYYITQVKTEPPAFAVFTNYSRTLKDAHIRFVEKGLRNRFSFKGTPIRIYVKPKERGKKVER